MQQETAGKQVPWESSSLSGNFSFYVLGEEQEKEKRESKASKARTGKKEEASFNEQSDKAFDPPGIIGF